MSHCNKTVVIRLPPYFSEEEELFWSKKGIGSLQEYARMQFAMAGYYVELNDIELISPDGLAREAHTKYYVYFKESIEL